MNPDAKKKAAITATNAGLGPGAALPVWCSVSGNSGDDAGLGINAPYPAVGVFGDKQVSFMIDGQAVGRNERLSGQVSVSAETALSRPGNRCKDARTPVYAADSRFRQEEEILCPIQGYLVDQAYLRLRCWATLAYKGPVASARYGLDHAGPGVDSPNAVVSAVCDIEIATPAHCQAARPIELGICRSSAIAGIAALAGSGNRGDRCRLPIHPKDTLVS
jgi:hypothetical protein